jgi:acetyl esterase/lipase
MPHPSVFRSSVYALLWLTGLACRTSPVPASEPGEVPVAAVPAAWTTTLVHKGPSPQGWQDEALPPDVRLERYESAGNALKLWVWQAEQPAGAEVTRRPVLLYLHGGFAFGLADLEDCRAFRDAGYAVVAPTYRGENGNPGAFELMLGEVDDAVAALRWTVSQPWADGQAVYVFGHSAGGGVADLMALRPDLPVRLSGSSGSLYGPDTFAEWSDIAPFDPSVPAEGRARSLFGRFGDVQRPHLAYMGVEDRDLQRIVRAQPNGVTGTKLELIALPGDHFSSLRPALGAFLERIRALPALPAP